MYNKQIFFLDYVVSALNYSCWVNVGDIYVASIQIVLMWNNKPRSKLKVPIETVEWKTYEVTNRHAKPLNDIFSF